MYKPGLGYHSVAKPGTAESTAPRSLRKKGYLLSVNFAGKDHRLYLWNSKILGHILFGGNPPKRKFVITENSERIIAVVQ